MYPHVRRKTWKTLPKYRLGRHCLCIDLEDIAYVLNLFDSIEPFSDLNVFLPRTDIPERLATALSLPFPVDGRACEDGSLDVGDQWYSSLNGASTHLETISHSVGIHGIWHIDHHVHLARLQEGQHVRLLGGLKNMFQYHSVSSVSIAIKQANIETAEMRKQLKHLFSVSHSFDQRLVDHAARHPIL